MQRKITNAELADLSTKWENPTVDTRHYIQCVMKAWEVDRSFYEAQKKDGGLCQAFKDRYYVA